jgi:hypothetical protein
MRTLVGSLVTLALCGACAERPRDCTRFAAKTRADVIFSARQLEGKTGTAAGPFGAVLPGDYVLAAELDRRGETLTFAGENIEIRASYVPRPTDPKGGKERYEGLRGKTGCFLSRILIQRLSGSLGAQVLDADRGEPLK